MVAIFDSYFLIQFLIFDIFCNYYFSSSNKVQNYLFIDMNLFSEGLFALLEIEENSLRLFRFNVRNVRL